MMAGNQYGGQHWQQNGRQQYQYDGRNDQRQWQEDGRGQDSYNQDYSRHNEYQQNHNGYGPGSAPAPPPVRIHGNAQWQGQGQGQYSHQGGYEEPYYEQSSANSRPPRQDLHDQGPPPQNRQYQYDERYRTNGQSRPSGPERGHSDHHRPPRDQWSQPSTPKKRSKPQQRILTEPTSPKNLAWDNPFGAFQAVKKKPDDKVQKHERHTSLDHAMATLNMNERRNSGGTMPRPQTSNGNRKEAQRPGTSHGTSHDRRPDMDQPPLPPQGYPAPMGRESPNMGRQGQPHKGYPTPVGRESPEMNHRQSPAPRQPPQGYPAPVGRDLPETNHRQSPAPRPQGGIDSLRMRPAGPGSSRGQPQPSPQSGPPMNQERPRPRPGPGAGSHSGRDDYNSQAVYNTQLNAPPPDQRRNNQVFDEGYRSDHIPQSRAHVSPIDRVQAADQYSRGAQQDYHSNSYGEPNPHNHIEQTQRESNGLPNFDAIPTQTSEKSEDNLIANRQPSFDQNIYRRPTYQSTEQIDTRQTHPSPPNQTTSPLADFSFDLPGSAPPRPDNSVHAAPYYNEQIPGSRGGPGGYGDSQPRDMQVSQYPPRAASRNGMKPPIGNDASRPPVPTNGQPYRSFSQDQYPARPHTSNAQRPAQQSYEMMNPYDQDPLSRAPSAPAVPVPFDQGYGPPGQNQYQQPYGQAPPMRKASHDNYNLNPKLRNQQPYGQSPPKRQASQENYNPGPPRPNAVVSAHPVPVRNYGPTPTAAINPDALPAHPSPARGGLSHNHGYQPVQSPSVQTPQKRDVSGPTPSVTSQELNSLRAKYSSNPSDYALGLKLAKKMVEAAKVLSDENGTADAKTTQKNREKYIFDAHKLIKKMVGANYPDAMFYLADCYGQGLLGLAVDAKEAFTLYQSAAKLNHPQSAYRVAVCCELGSEEGGGTRRDPLKAMQWYKRAATLGDTPAMYKMGMILLKGLLSQQKNPREAVSWLKRAAERADKDNPHGLHELGLLYESPTPPDNILRDERYALQLFQQAAELGYKYSQFRLGSAYEYGLLDCPIDARQSIAWYTRAAAQGEHQSQLALSGWYLTGSEPLLTQSDTEAFLWARKAASSGLAKAEYAMGYFNEVGIGTAVDMEEAKRWYYRAASQNFAKARERLEDLKRGGPKQQKTRMSRSNVNRQSDGECSVM